MTARFSREFQVVRRASWAGGDNGPWKSFNHSRRLVSRFMSIVSFAYLDRFDMNGN